MLLQNYRAAGAFTTEKRKQGTRAPSEVIASGDGDDDA